MSQWKRISLLIVFALVFGIIAFFQVLHLLWWEGKTSCFF
ncbi:hypothetical protein RRB88_03185, partial [Staphylococcus aureus]|nr:hypothetical protein [Staphylococcus aureus]